MYRHKSNAKVTKYARGYILEKVNLIFIDGGAGRGGPRIRQKNGLKYADELL